MKLNTISYKQQRWNLKQAKQSVITAKELAALHKNNSIPYSHMRFNTTTQKMLGLLLLSTAVKSILPPCHAAEIKSNACDDTVDSPCLVAKVPHSQIAVKYAIPKVSIMDCNHLYDSLEQIQTKLPESYSLINRVTRQSSFSFSCQDQQFFGQEETIAHYRPSDNTIYFRSHRDSDVTYHHEMLHADTSRRHRTPYCNLETLSEKSKTQLSSAGIFPPKEHPRYLWIDATTAPIWPLTLENINVFQRILEKDRELGKIQKLQELHLKFHREQTMTEEEQTLYKSYRQIFKGILGKQKKVSFKSAEVQALLKKDKHIMSNGVVLTHMKLISDKDGSAIVLGRTDDVSTFIMNVVRAYQRYQKHLKEDGIVVAITELEIYLREGLPKAALQEFLPNLWEHLQREEACCDQGIVRKCYKSSVK